MATKKGETMKPIEPTEPTEPIETTTSSHIKGNAMDRIMQILKISM